MAGPRVRGNLRVDRVVDTLRLQQREQIITASTTNVLLTAGSPYETIVVDPTMGTPAQPIRLPQVSNNEDEAGIGTEFRFTNNATSAVTVSLASGGAITNGTVSTTRTIIAFCTALGSTPGTLADGTWKIVALDAAATTGRADPNVISFNATSSWGTAAGGEYTLTVDPGTGAGNHSKSPNPHAIVYDSSNQLTFIETLVTPPNSVSPLVSNRVEIKVNEVPDGRFIGRIEIY